MDKQHYKNMVIFASGGMIACLMMLIIFIVQAKQTEHCDDGHIGFRIEQCMGGRKP